MNQFIIRYRIITNRGSGYNAGNFVNVYWDDVAATTVVYKFNDALDNVGAIQASGPDLGADRFDHEPVSPARPIPYKFCNGTTLNTFGQRSTFPYVNRIETPNHFSCDIVVCDIRIVGATATDASDSATADGSITVIAETSKPDVRYSLEEEFSGGGQLSGQFTGLVAGNYTVWARDSRGCTSFVNVTVGTPTTYGTKYRLEYYDKNKNKTRVDILERGYEGDPINVCGSGDPFVLRYNGDGESNKFKTIIPSEAILTLQSPSNFYFRELFSQDERKYKLEYSKDFGIIQPAVDYIPNLNTFVDGGGANPVWATGSNPKVVMTGAENSNPLQANVSIPVGSIPIDYNIDVLSTNQVFVFVNLYDADMLVCGSVVIIAQPGNNTGVINIDSSSSAVLIQVVVFQKIPQLPILSTWQQRIEENRVLWETGIPQPKVTLPGGKISTMIWCYYQFIAGQSYNIAVTIDKDVISGAGGSSLYIQGRTGAFTIMYASVPTAINGGDGTFVRNFTFVAPSNDMVVLSLYISNRSESGSVLYELVSVQITNVDYPNSEVTINELSSSVPQIGGMELKWTGFVISQIYSEPYDAPKNYPVTIRATDGLADLSTYDFVDKYGNKFESDIITLDAVLSILRKTDLGLNLITAVNRLEVSMTSNALKESMINPKTFYTESGAIDNCAFALEQLLKSFGVRIFQRNCKWVIVTVEEAVHKFNAMEFAPDGQFIQSLQIEDIIAITGPIGLMESAFINRDQVLEVVPAYGKMSFEHLLIQHPSLVKSYSFEQDDIFLTPDGVVAFDAWNVNIERSPGADYGIKKTKSFEGDYNFFYKVPYIPYAEPGYLLVLTSTEGIIEYDANDLFEYKFDYATITGKLSETSYGKPHNPFWVRLKWSLRVGAYYFDDITGDWTTTKKYNDIYVDTFNDPQSYKIVAPFREVPVLTIEQFQVEFVLTDNNVFDFDSDGTDFSELTSIPTVNLHEGYRVKGRVQGSSPGGGGGSFKRYLYYELSYETSDNDELKSIRPSDFDENTNPKVWVLQENSLVRRAFPRGGTLKILEAPSPEVPVKYQYLDNVVLRSLPGGTEPPENITIIRSNNLNIKINFDDVFLFNDIDIENINNSERIYKNYFKKLDGTPTQLWKRTYRDGQAKLLELLSADFASQYSQPVNRLTGSMIYTKEVSYATLMRELGDQNRLYMFMGLELHDRQYSVIFDLMELKDVVNDDTSGAVDAGFTAGFTLGFRA